MKAQGRPGRRDVDPPHLDGIDRTALAPHTANVLAGEIAHIVKIAEKKGLAPVSNATLSVVGGLISQPIYMDAVKQALSRVGVVFGDVQLVQDAAGEGAAALAIPHK